MSKNILEMELKELRTLKRGDFEGQITQPEINHIFKVCDALWFHSGNPKAPHAELASGKCGNGFVDALRVLRHSNLCEIMADQLIKVLRTSPRFQPLIPIDWVIGSDHAGADFSHDVARLLNADHDFTEKGPNKTQIWNRFVIEPGQVVLQAEELVTTTETLQAVRDGILLGNPHPVRFAPQVLALVHRSDTSLFSGLPIVYLVHYDIKTWDPKKGEKCPLCALGSKKVRPKQNWAELTAVA